MAYAEGVRGTVDAKRDCNMKPIPLIPCCALLFGLAAPVTQAVPILGAHVVVENTGPVVATFLGHTAGYTSDLYLSSPGFQYIFTNHTTPVGTSVNLGTFAAGTELIFQIYVRNTGYSYYSGPAARNPDGLAHAVVDSDYSPTATYVGFEDLFGGGDLDYDDLNFSFTNVRASEDPPVNTPDGGATAALLGIGLAGLACVRRKVQS